MDNEAQKAAAAPAKKTTVPRRRKPMNITVSDDFRAQVSRMAFRQNLPVGRFLENLLKAEVGNGVPPAKTP